MSVGTPRRARRSDGQRKVDLILEAAVRVVGSGGIAALTHRAVADAAGVPLGSTTYHFADRSDLLHQAMKFAMDRESARLSAIVEEAEPARTAAEAARTLTAMFFDKTVACPLYDLALFEMFMEATRDEAYRAESLAWSHMVGELMDRVLPPTDPALPRADVVQIVATLIDGLMLEEIANRTLGVTRLELQLLRVLERFVA